MSVRYIYNLHVWYAEQCSNGNVCNSQGRCAQQIPVGGVCNATGLHTQIMSPNVISDAGFSISYSQCCHNTSLQHCTYHAQPLCGFVLHEWQARSNEWAAAFFMHPLAGQNSCQQQTCCFSCCCDGLATELVRLHL